MHPLVALKGFSKHYRMGEGLVEALSRIDLSIDRGEFIAVMGPSGSGKSTLMHLIGCLDKPTEGTYLLDGSDISSLNDAALSQIRSEHIGFVFQSFNLIPQLNVYENVAVPFQYQTKPKADIHRAVSSAIDRVGLTHRTKHLPRELSGGEMQRVAIARAIAIEPWLILADEPTGNLDSENGKKILSLFGSLHAQGATLLMVTHDEAVARHAQTIVRMRDGKIITRERVS